jgi:hypothetical protein
MKKLPRFLGRGIVYFKLTGLLIVITPPTITNKTITIIREIAHKGRPAGFHHGLTWAGEGAGAGAGDFAAGAGAGAGERL